MAARSHPIALALLVTTAGGCALQPAVTPGGRPAASSLVLMRPQLLGDSSAWEASRNDERVLGRTAPAAGAVQQWSVMEGRQRLSISGGRPRESTTFTWSTLRVTR